MGENTKAVLCDEMNHPRKASRSQIHYLLGKRQTGRREYALEDPDFPGRFILFEANEYTETKVLGVVDADGNPWQFPEGAS